MRHAVIVAITAVALSGCAATGLQSGSTSPTDDGSNAAGGAAAPGGDFGPTMSSAGRALLDQGRAQRLAGEYPQASATLERALRIEPQQASIWIELGTLRFEEGNFAQAEQMGRKALSLASDGSSLHLQAVELIDDSRRAGGR